MKRSFAAFVAIAFGLSAGGASAFAAESCLACHADAARMKALFVAPAIVATEGEG